MNSQIKKRKKRFFAFCIAMMFTFLQMDFVTIFAADRNVIEGADGKFDIDAVILYAGDTLYFTYSQYTSGKATINYYDYDGTTLLGTDTFGTVGYDYTQTKESMKIKSYSSDSEQDPVDFKGWKVQVVKGSSGCFQSATLYAVKYDSATIEYSLEEGAVNSDLNPASYYVGKEEIALADASKENYNFDGWYTDAEFSADKKVTAITVDMTGPLKFYAKFSPKAFAINYHNVDGANNTNPTEYTYSKGVESFADASKENYTFDGWYSDAAFTTPITGISGTQAGDIDVYAKFTADKYEISYNLDGGENGAGNPTEYTYGVGVDSFADASKESYTFGGWYFDNLFTSKAESISKTQTGDIKLFAKYDLIKYDLIKKTGVGSVMIPNINYGRLPMPMLSSSTNGTDKAVVQYKLKNASDSTYTSVKPTRVGQYTARVIYPETETYKEIIALCDFSIKFLDTPPAPYVASGKQGEAGYYTSSVSIVPPVGYLVSNSLDGTYTEKLTIDDTIDELTIYLMKANTGEKTSGIQVSGIKIDSEAPVIQKPSSEKTIYGDSAQIIVKDKNLKNVLVNGKAVKFESGSATLNLDSNNGEESYDITCVDIAGNKTEMNIVVAAEWMKTRTIPSNATVKLLAKYSYNLAGGSWKVGGDNTVYSGGSSFYVSSDGEYTFSQGQ